MLFGVQIIGILFGLIMIYMTFLYYKKANYDRRGFFVWLLIWLGFIFLVSFPQTVYGVMEALKIDRTADFFYITGFLFFSVILFYIYNIAKKNQKQIENIVRTIAIENGFDKKKMANMRIRKKTKAGQQEEYGKNDTERKGISKKDRTKLENN